MTDTAIESFPSSDSEPQLQQNSPSRTSSMQSFAADDDNAAVMALASKLAPVLQQADELFHVPAEFYRADNDVDYDDDLGEEVQALHISEQLLREEMELASDFSNLFSSPRFSFERDDEDEDNLLVTPTAEGANSVVRRRFSWNNDNIPSVLDAATNTMEADFDDSEQQQVPEQELLDSNNNTNRTKKSSLQVQTSLMTPPRNPNSSVHSVLSPIPIVSASGAHSVANPPASSSGVIVATPESSSKAYYTNWDHLKTLAVDAESKGWYSVDLTPVIVASIESFASPPPPSTLKEFCLSIPEARFKHLFVGLPENGAHLSGGTPSAATLATPVLPVRTLTIRIRPDVLCGAVMDSVHQTLQNLSATIIKRQGGHLKASIPSATYVPLTKENDNNHAGEIIEANTNTRSYPGFFADIQLCTSKSDHCARTLLMRIYHDTHQFDLHSQRRLDDNETLDDLLATTPVQNQLLLEELVDETASIRLREACALIQRIESPRKRPKRIDATPRSVQDMKQLVSDHLLSNYNACPSAEDGSVTMPGLNSYDWAVIVSSWRLIRLVWDELQDRDLTFLSLCNNWFGAFPALPTLDVHYCSQIRRLSREGMIVELLKSASELEDYAREAEYSCANLISLLQPTFETYGIVAPSLPKATPLTAYPLEFTAPQQACPPWGQKVLSALNEIQSWTSEVNTQMDHLGEPNHLDAESCKSSLDMAEKAVYSVLRAFQMQDDEEKSARLGRKNVQVIDRLAKMEEHQLVSIRTLDEAHLQSDKAALAAKDFESKSGVMEVPLIKWSIVVGGSTGTCFVTARRILFITQLIPVIGGSKISVWDLQEVDFTVQESAASMLNPLPTIISVIKDGREVYSFRPSMGGSRLKSFLDIVKATSKSLPPRAMNGEV
ncbi:hypothetical protein MPSEU_000324500 [Mayamaea pseudoterrestris]|nr:hypothetical protein MPSEU_000324500 [Mayamaea pseudoterrestris]